MKRFFTPALFAALSLLLLGCGENRPKKSYDAKALIEHKCAKCHNLQMPPKTYADEKAPPMMAVVFHVRDFMKVENPSDKRQKFINFVTDYVLHPDASKSFCDKKSLETYGIMPSQQGKVTPEELEAIAGYMYEHYDPEKYMKIMTERARLAALPAYKRILETKNCLGCHGIRKKKLAPSFVRIAQKYGKAHQAVMMESIKNGSRGKWKGFKLMMPPFKDLNSSDLEAITEWILQQRNDL